MIVTTRILLSVPTSDNPIYYVPSLLGIYIILIDRAAGHVLNQLNPQYFIFFLVSSLFI